MTSQRKAIVYSNVRQFSEQGHEALRSGDVSKASVYFSHALEKAELYGDEFLIRACSFNLGSCLVAFGEASRGLVYLTRAVPPQDQSDGPENFADLQYNIGIAKHAVGDVVNAVLAYEKAANLYKELHNKPLQVQYHTLFHHISNVLTFHIKYVKIADACILNKFQNQPEFVRYPSPTNKLWVRS